MKPAPFDYHRASSVDEAVDALAATGGKVLAGGQSLVPLMSMRLASPPALVDINPIPASTGSTSTRRRCRIGATVRHRSLELDDRGVRREPAAAPGACAGGAPTIRNRGTTVGSLIHADPAAEMPAVLALLGARWT